MFYSAGTNRGQLLCRYYGGKGGGGEREKEKDRQRERERQTDRKRGRKREKRAGSTCGTVGKIVTGRHQARGRANVIGRGRARTCASEHRSATEQHPIKASDLGPFIRQLNKDESAGQTCVHLCVIETKTNQPHGNNPPNPPPPVESLGTDLIVRQSDTALVSVPATLCLPRRHPDTPLTLPGHPPLPRLTIHR